MPDAVGDHHPIDATRRWTRVSPRKALLELVALFARHGDAYRTHSPAIERDLFAVCRIRTTCATCSSTTPPIIAKGIGIERVAILLGNGLDDQRAAAMAHCSAAGPALRSTARPSHARRAGHDRGEPATRQRAGETAARAGTTINLTQDMSEVTLEGRAARGVRNGARARGRRARRGAFALLTQESGRNLEFAYAFANSPSRSRPRSTRAPRRIEPRDDILQMLLLDARDRRAGDPMADRQLVDEILTLVVAGHETTASTLNWVWYLLALIRPPTRACTPNSPQPRSSRGMRTSSGLRSRARSSTGAAPVSAGLMLTRRAPGRRHAGRVRLPTGAEYWSRRTSSIATRAGQLPERFDPDRSTPDAVAARDRFALPFGLGPRACIGEHFALVEMPVARQDARERASGSSRPRASGRARAQVNLRARGDALVMLPTLRPWPNPLR